ncbi:hypothetical protein [Pseudactinotalea sp. Z1748]|uniref:hypothetical protein n=1 Tax=Pseudactinotalea sp. Z1748 TaxID=3413027 RepID=UPI003C7ECD83
MAAWQAPRAILVAEDEWQKARPRRRGSPSADPATVAAGLRTLAQPRPGAASRAAAQRRSAPRAILVAEDEW